ncbi:MAG: hypothetical protein EP344_08725 [Bacteroidetes bacterium]|nr:MAG: hypothetical protein EP344_08725 [Bacteroidota bacterium]
MAFLPFLVFWVQPNFGTAQETIQFNANGKLYRANIVWIVKHNGVTYRQQTAHALDRTGADNFDLAVHFAFENDTVPEDPNLVWGFQFEQGGNLITPARNEKISRSVDLFQRFHLSGTGDAYLTISPKIWRRTPSDQYQVVTQATPVIIGFTVTAPTLSVTAAEPARTRQDSTRRRTQPISTLPSVQPNTDEERAYAEAVRLADTQERIKALIDFVDTYAEANPRSGLVAEAIKNIPLGTSLPKRQNENAISYIIDNAVNPRVDSSSGWRTNLSPEGFGRFRLTLDDLGDTVHYIRIADPGKNAPYNRPRELSPFEQIKVELAGEDIDSFRIKTMGGTPPFIIFLSQNKVHKIRYILNQTDTTWAFSKASCTSCKTGKHTLEVYNSDFSTLLLRVEGAIHIRKINYYNAGAFAVLGLLLLSFAYKPLVRAWRRYRYNKTLREIEAWEEKG